MADFALTNNGTGYDVDLPRGSNGKRDLRIVRNRPATAQRLQFRMRTFLGESRYNRLAGMPWTQIIFQKGTTLDVVRAVIEQHVINTPGIKRMLDMPLTYDRKARKLIGSAVVEGDDGEKFTIPIELSRVLP